MKLLTIVTSLNSNLYIELRFYGVIKVTKDRVNIRFVGNKKDSSKIGMVVNKGYEPLFFK